LNEVSLQFQYWAASGYAKNQRVRMGRRFRLWQQPELEIAGATFRVPMVEDEVRPLLVSGLPVIPIYRVLSQVHVLGQVSFPTGYPVIGNRGGIVAEYALEYKGGRQVTLPVRQGIECAQANCIAGASRIAPVATSAQPALHFIKDPARERYQILLRTIAVEARELASIRCVARDGGEA
jgi:hypothetical protein